jgi:hypothetical protein
MESDLDNRNRIENAKISRNYGSTLVRDVRERYGENLQLGTRTPQRFGRSSTGSMQRH